MWLATVPELDPCPISILWTCPWPSASPAYPWASSTSATSWNLWGCKVTCLMFDSSQNYARRSFLANVNIKKPKVSQYLLQSPSECLTKKVPNIETETWKCASNIWASWHCTYCTTERPTTTKGTQKHQTDLSLTWAWLQFVHLRKHRKRRSRHTRRNWTSPRVAPRAPSVPGLGASAWPSPWAEDSPKVP